MSYGPLVLSHCLSDEKGDIHLFHQFKVRTKNMTEGIKSSHCSTNLVYITTKPLRLQKDTNSSLINPETFGMYLAHSYVTL